LCAPVKVHVGVNREIVATFQADPTTFPIGLNKTPINGEGVGFADGTIDGLQPFFCVLKADTAHVSFPFQSMFTMLKYSGQSTVAAIRKIH